MEELKLGEKIDDIIFKAKMEQGEESKYRKQILAIIKKAGYQSPKEVRRGKEQVREAFRFPKLAGRK